MNTLGEHSTFVESSKTRQLQIIWQSIPTAFNNLICKTKRVVISYFSACTVDRITKKYGSVQTRVDSFSTEYTDSLLTCKCFDILF